MKKLVFILLACQGVSSAFANVTLNFTGADVSKPDIFTVQYGRIRESAVVSKLDFTESNGTKLVSVCADVTSSIVSGPLSYFNPIQTGTNATSPGINLAGEIVELNFNAAKTADQQAGLQLAVWSAIYNGGTTFKSNGAIKFFGVSKSVLSDAASYYAATQSTHLISGSATYFRGNGPHSQSQLTFSAAPVPEPMPAALAGIAAVAGFGLIRRRR